MELWIILSVAAAAFQTARFMLQKTLSMGPLTAAGATFARFFYAAPFAMLAACAYVLAQGKGLPGLGGFFWIYVLCGGLAQILATLFVVMLFATRNFAVGITLKKTEVIQTALAGFLILGDRVSLAGMLAILIGLFGVLILSDPPEIGARGWARLRNRAAGLGLASGALFAISAVTYRGATLEVASDDIFMRAVLSVAAVTASQSLAMGLWLRWRAPGCGLDGAGEPHGQLLLVHCLHPAECRLCLCGGAGGGDLLDAGGGAVFPRKDLRARIMGHQLADKQHSGSRHDIETGTPRDAGPYGRYWACYA